DRRVVEMQTVLNGVRAGAVATRKFYQDEVQKQLSPEQRAAAQTEIDGFIGEVEGSSSASDQLRRDLDDAKGSVRVDDAEMLAAQQLRGQYDGVLKRLHDLDVRVRAQLSSSDRSKAEQIESILDRAHAVDQKVTAFNGRIDKMLDERLKDLQSELGDEKLKV